MRSRNSTWCAAVGYGRSAVVAGQGAASDRAVCSRWWSTIGPAPVLTDILSGQVQLMFSIIVALVLQVKAGKVRALAVTSRRQASLLPDVPTLDESGLKGYEAGSWYGILVPAGTPKDIITRLNAEIVRAIRQPEMRERLASEGSGSGRRYPRGICRPYPGRTRSNGKADPGRAHQGGLTPERSILRLDACARDHIAEEVGALFHQRSKFIR